MATNILYCFDCGQLHDAPLRVCNCGSDQLADAEMEHVIARLDEVVRERDQALKALAQAQMTAGAFQTEALLLRGEVDALKSRRRA